MYLYQFYYERASSAITFENSSKKRTTHTKVPKIDATDGFSVSYNVTYFGIVLM